MGVGEQFAAGAAGGDANRITVGVAGEGLGAVAGGFFVGGVVLEGVAAGGGEAVERVVAVVGGAVGDEPVEGVEGRLSRLSWKFEVAVPRLRPA
ncbi:MAG TPA: hypothetical protein VFN75_12515 [Pseudonocardiaceae bacterium]|nr:hypothetical protein [Pseudonocardiaceae bacterium]